ncbi:MAG: acetoacetate--CoA ligase [Pleurocapsa sp. SU_196_0]|nr:acetoacetate--CoA ligase [Pleurocapsa sp. SU_196_0]
MRSFQQPTPLEFTPVPFDHPLYVLYSSGTTGLPKPIIHGHGGILLEHEKALRLQLDLRPDDRFFWFTTTGWMMWNFLVSGLLVGSTIVLFDGSPTHPTPDTLWKLAQDARINLFGCGAALIHSSLKAGLRPVRDLDLSALRVIGSTGSPLSLEGFAFVYEHVKSDVWLSSLSGGTDVCSAFLGGSPWTPVWAGELSCRALGANVQAFDSDGNAVLGTVGELVLTAPMPSMPVGFWNDPDSTRLRSSYFESFPGIWRHGDWVRFTTRGSAVISGRSDATINRAGVRMGTAELYSAVERIPEIEDSLVVDLERDGAENFMPLFVVLRNGESLSADLERRVRSEIRSSLSPRHVPDVIVAVPRIPRTLNGKKLELPVKNILLGAKVSAVANPESLSVPSSLEFFVAYARTLEKP